MRRQPQETAVQPRFQQRETRFCDVMPNPYDRVTFAPDANRFQVLRPYRGRLVPFGSYATLEEAIAARDAAREADADSNVLTITLIPTEEQ